MFYISRAEDINYILHLKHTYLLRLLTQTALPSFSKNFITK